MRVSPAGRAAIRQREGCRLSAYQDSRGIWTIGVGHVDMTPPVTHAGMRITSVQADQYLAADLAPVEAAIARSVLVPLSQNQCDALASLAFNIGTSGFKRSTVVSRLNRGDYAGASDAFMLWSKPAVLTARRKAERAQFLMPDAPQEPVLARAKPAPSLVDRIAPLAPAPRLVPVASAAAIPAPGLFTRLAFFFGRH